MRTLATEPWLSARTVNALTYQASLQPWSTDWSVFLNIMVLFDSKLPLTSWEQSIASHKTIPWTVMGFYR